MKRKRKSKVMKTQKKEPKRIIIRKKTRKPIRKMIKSSQYSLRKFSRNIKIETKRN